MFACQIREALNSIEPGHWFPFHRQGENPSIIRSALGTTVTALRQFPHLTRQQTHTNAHNVQLTQICLQHRFRCRSIFISCFLACFGIAAMSVVTPQKQAADLKTVDIEMKPSAVDTTSKDELKGYKESTLAYVFRCALPCRYTCTNPCTWPAPIMDRMKTVTCMHNHEAVRQQPPRCLINHG